MATKEEKGARERARKALRKRKDTPAVGTQVTFARETVRDFWRYLKSRRNGDGPGDVGADDKRGAEHIA